MRFLVGLLLLSALSGCAVLEPTQGHIIASSSGTTLFVANRTDARIYHFIVGRETAALINWAPSLNPENSVDRGKTARIRHDDIFRSETEHEVIVYWWHAVERDGQQQPGEIQSVVARL